MLALFVTSKSLSANDVEEIFFAALPFRIKSPQSVASPPSRKKKNHHRMEIRQNGLSPVP